MDIKDVIETKIKEAGLSKKSVAERMGIASQNLNSMITAPSWPTLERLAAALGMTVAELISECEKTSTPIVVCPNCGKEIKVTLETPDTMCGGKILIDETK